MSDEMEKVAIIGMSGAFPGARNIGELWALLCQGRDGISTLSREELVKNGESSELIDNPEYIPRGGFLEDAEYFDNSFFGVSPSEALAMDPQQRLFLQHSYLAMEDAGYIPGNSNKPVGVFAGEAATQYWFLLKNGPQSRSLEDFRLMLGNEKDFIATRTSYKLNLKGPSFNIQSACSTSLATVAFACQSLLTWGCDLALAGGVMLTAPRKRGYLAYEGMIFSPTGSCRPFDARADGTIFGEGIGVVCLKRLSEAISDGDTIYAVINSVSMNNDGADKIGFTAPSVNGQVEAIQMAQAMAEVHPDDIEFVETHGTATPLGDPIEIQALKNAFRGEATRSAYCYLGSIKANIGHLDVAAGVASLIKTALVLKTGIIPPLANFNSLNPHLDLDSSPFRINTIPVVWPKRNGKRIAGLSSFGIGGTNLHAILESPPESEPRVDAEKKGSPLLLGAKTAESLEEYIKAVSVFLNANPSVPAEFLADKLMKTRHDFPWRQGFFFTTRDGLLQDLSKSFTAGNAVIPGKTMFMFPGQGAQFSGMAHAFYGNLEVFTQWVDKGVALAESLGCGNLRAYLLEDGFEAEIAHTETTQPLLYIIEYALAKQLVEEGIEPAAVAGHSIGEYAAAALAGAMSFEDGLRLVRMRGYWMERAEPGAMLALAMSGEEGAEFVHEGLSISVRNTENQIVLSGSIGCIEKLELILKSREIKYTRLKTSHAFHSPLMDTILADFAAEVRKTHFSPLRIPFLSNLDGAWLEGSVDWNEYWITQLRQPVRFDLGLREIEKAGNLHIIEAGPGRTLTGFIRSSIPDRTDVFPILPNARTDIIFFEKSLVQFWEQGIEIKWKNSPKRPCDLVLFPGYPFAKNRFWPKGNPERESTVTLINDTPDYTAEKNLPFSNDAAQSIRDLWRGILGNREFDDDTNFFLCGGDSFSGIQLVEKLKRQLNIEIHIKDFIQSPTITGIMKLRHEKPSLPSSGKYLFPIQTSGDSPALFLVAGAHENRYLNPDSNNNSYEEDFFRYFSNMISTLGDRQPLYGFRPKGLVLQEHLHSSVECMASAYIEAMKQIQGKGPYYLAGECVGGIVAYEMACQLERKGETVAQLILLDTPRPSRWVSFREDSIYLRHLTAKIVRLTVKRIMSAEISSLTSRLLPWMNLIGALCFPVTRSARIRRRGFLGSLLYQHILLSYNPARYNGRVTYIINEAWNKKHFMMGWKRNLGSTVCVFEVPGTHETRLKKSGEKIGLLIRHLMNEK